MVDRRMALLYNEKSAKIREQRTGTNDVSTFTSDVLLPHGSILGFLPFPIHEDGVLSDAWGILLSFYAPGGPN